MKDKKLIEDFMLKTGGTSAVIEKSAIRIKAGNRIIMEASQPVKAQIKGEKSNIYMLEGDYAELVEEEGVFIATGFLEVPGGGKLVFEDKWLVKNETINMSRNVSVEEERSGYGFLTRFELCSVQEADLDDIEAFIPAVLYGDTSYLPAGAIGSRKLRKEGVRDLLLREDGLPAPLAAARSPDGASVFLLHSDPRGTTNLSDSNDLIGHTLINKVFDFASIGFREVDGRLNLALWFPGTEGAAMRASFDWGKRKFRPNTWRRRYHPMEKGVAHKYECSIGTGWHKTFPSMLKWAWRKAFDLLDPQVVIQDLPCVEKAVISHLGSMFEEQPDGAVGIPFLVDADTGYVDDGFYGLGFCGRNEEVAFQLIRIGHKEGNPVYLEQGRKIFDFWTSRTGPGFTPVAYRPDKKRFGGQDWFIHKRSNIEEAPPEGEAASLRELAEGHLGCLRAWRFEKNHGIDQPLWFAWCAGFGDWLLKQQYPSGSFPRWWRLNGDVLDPSSNGAFNAIPFLCELYGATGETKYLAGAVRAGEYLWTEPQCSGIFRGGTIDNPDVIDKEAASLSMEGFLSLYEATKEQKWLDAAVIAADVTASWIYLWNVPMPLDADPDSLDWKPGVPTAGFQACAVGGGGGDQYLAFNSGDFMHLYKLTGDRYYLRISDLLLHNTKVMLAIPGRTFDLKGPGWQQEHWGMSLPRGCGHHRAWLPWVTVCHLVGMHGYEVYSEGKRV